MAKVHVTTVVAVRATVGCGGMATALAVTVTHGATMATLPQAAVVAGQAPARPTTV